MGEIVNYITYFCILSPKSCDSYIYEFLMINLKSTHHYFFSVGHLGEFSLQNDSHRPFSLLNSDEN